MTKPFQSQLGVFARYWEAGQVKTRLADDTSDEFAARAYQMFIKATLETATGLADRQVLVFTPDDRVGEFACWVPPDWTLVNQASGDLGQRMHAYFAEADAHQIEKVILIGSDSPSLPREILQRALAQLDDSQCVLGPSHDGGYYLIGSRNLVPPVFTGISWSTEHVLRQTVEKLKAADISYSILPTWFDIDTIEDFQKLQNELETSDHWLCSELHSLQQEYLA